MRAIFKVKFQQLLRLEHPPYWPDLVSADFFPFPRLKTLLKGEQFADAEVVKHKETKQFKSFLKNEFKSDLNDCMNIETSVLLWKDNILMENIFSNAWPIH